MINRQFENIQRHIFKGRDCVIKSAAVCHMFWHVWSAGAAHSNAATAAAQRACQGACWQRALKLRSFCSSALLLPFVSLLSKHCNSTLGFRLLPFAAPFDERYVLRVCFANGFVFNGLLVTFISPSFLLKWNETNQKQRNARSNALELGVIHKEN